MSNDRLLGSVPEEGPARLLDEEEVDRLVAERDRAEKDEESK